MIGRTGPPSAPLTAVRGEPAWYVRLLLGALAAVIAMTGSLMVVAPAGAVPPPPPNPSDDQIQQSQDDAGHRAQSLVSGRWVASA